MVAPTNSKVTRVLPIFGWLIAKGGRDWPARLLEMADGFPILGECGAFKKHWLDPERKVRATKDRLIWMLRNANSLTPRNRRRRDELRGRVKDQNAVHEAIENLKAGKAPRKGFGLEGPSHADCLIECEHMFLWIEGKRFDSLDPSTTWDVCRDQLARNVEAVRSLAHEADKEYRVLVCHEFPLKHHEASLLDGYRAGTWAAGWPHIDESDRPKFAERIGTLTWSKITDRWPDIPMMDGDSRLRDD
jgi:hypothetical protein